MSGDPADGSAEEAPARLVCGHIDDEVANDDPRKLMSSNTSISSDRNRRPWIVTANQTASLARALPGI